MNRRAQRRPHTGRCTVPLATRLALSLSFALCAASCDSGPPPPDNWEEVFEFSASTLTFTLPVNQGGMYFPSFADEEVVASLTVRALPGAPDVQTYLLRGASNEFARVTSPDSYSTVLDPSGIEIQVTLSTEDLWASVLSRLDSEDFEDAEQLEAAFASGSTAPIEVGALEILLSMYTSPWFEPAIEIPIEIVLEVDNPIPAFAFDPSPLHLEVFDGWYDMTFVDLDGDGDLDAIKADRGQAAENIGTSGTPVWVVNDSMLGGLPSNNKWPNPLAFGDLDADGDLDAIELSDDSAVGYRNEGTANSPAFVIDDSLVVAMAGGEAPYLMDIDGDGDLDILQRDLEYAWQNVGSVLSPIWAKSPGLMAWAGVFIELFGSDIDGLCVTPLVPEVGPQVVFVDYHNPLGKVACVATLQLPLSPEGSPEMVDYRCQPVTGANHSSEGGVHCLDFNGDGLPDLGYRGDGYSSELMVSYQTK